MPRDQDRSRGSPSLNRTTPTPGSSSDDGGCLLVLLVLLWYFGFISFHSREKGRELDRLGDVQVQLAKAQSQLTEITKVAREMESQADVLDARRATLQRQVADLERVRDEIALSLQAASKAFSQRASTRWYGFFESLFTGVLGNLISAWLLAAGGWFVGRRVWRVWRVWRASSRHNNVGEKN